MLQDHMLRSFQQIAEPLPPLGSLVDIDFVFNLPEDIIKFLMNVILVLLKMRFEFLESIFILIEVIIIAKLNNFFSKLCFSVLDHIVCLYQ